jgi:hypothetical protein
MKRSMEKEDVTGVCRGQWRGKRSLEKMTLEKMSLEYNIITYIITSVPA